MTCTSAVTSLMGRAPLHVVTETTSRGMAVTQDGAAAFAPGCTLCSQTEVPRMAPVSPLPRPHSTLCLLAAGASALKCFLITYKIKET